MNATRSGKGNRKPQLEVVSRFEIIFPSREVSGQFRPLSRGEVRLLESVRRSNQFSKSFAASEKWQIEPVPHKAPSVRQCRLSVATSQRPGLSRQSVSLHKKLLP